MRDFSNEILLDPAGKVAGVVVGAGGFLGMGEHDVLVKIDQMWLTGAFPIGSISSAAAVARRSF